MTTKPSILVVDDEETICEVLKINLEIAGYDVDVAYSAEEVLKLSLEKYSLIISDVMMGEIDGFELSSRIKANPATAEIPIILCTAKTTEGDLVEGFNRGADDYIRKPFSMKELVLRVKSVLKRSASIDSTKNILSYENLVLVMDKKKCKINGEEIDLTKKEFEILQLFLSSKGKIFSREEILDKVWEADVLVIDRTIDVNINRLRKKIGIYGSNIITKLGYGYGFEE